VNETTNVFKEIIKRQAVPKRILLDHQTHTTTTTTTTTTTIIIIIIIINWLKAFPATHSYIILVETFNKIIEKPKQIPTWLTAEIAYLLPKSINTKKPKNYWLITFLSTMYKMLTGIIARRISTHLQEHNLLSAEQKGCHLGSKGCKDQLLTSKTVFEDYIKRKKEINMAWIDNQKAFDRVPHSWIEKSTELVGVKDSIVKVCKYSMDKWNTKLQLKTNQEVMQSKPIKINRGIF
jgi:hypothetical protein